MGRVSGVVVPVETARVAWAASPKGTPAMVMRDRLEDLFVDDDFVGWFPVDGRRGVSPGRLALVSVLQYAENLTDRQVARAVACRIDWKYALGMELTERGFDHSVLSEFRERLAEGDRADRLLAVMVDRLAEAGLVRARGRQRTDSTHVLAAVRRLGRVELVAETMRAALEALAKVDEVWLAGVMPPEWAQRYGRSVRHERQPTGSVAVREYVEQVGAGGVILLWAVTRSARRPGAATAGRAGRGGDRTVAAPIRSGREARKIRSSARVRSLDPDESQVGGILTASSSSTTRRTAGSNRKYGQRALTV
ncbi:hypothetical protein C5N14_28815 [Micromonospora sp. MW-13]|nr:hypothetical protein C5N14_28815 [Micromonospora sp. MW-13]